MPFQGRPKLALHISTHREMTHANKTKPVPKATASKPDTEREPPVTESEQCLNASEMPNVQKHEHRAYEIFHMASEN